MFSSSRLMACLYTLLVFFLCGGSVSKAFAWTLRFAPLGHTTVDAEALTPATSVPVTPQFFRILVTPQQVVVGAEDPYSRVIKFNPPIRFKPLPPSAAQPVASARHARPRHQLRGPETFLLRRTQNVAGKSLQYPLAP
jgi:hypothetical protein